MKEELVTFETAKLAKEKGFDIETYTAYIGGKFFESEDESNGYDGFDLAQKNNWNRNGWVFSKDGCGCFGCKLDNIKYFEAYTVTTQSLLQRWLREVHEINVLFTCHQSNASKIFYDFCLYIPYGYQSKMTAWSIVKFDTYEEALEKGLQEALKLI